MIALILIVLVVLTALFATIQTLYAESMRLRGRESPALEFFKETLEAKLRIRTEEGALSFSLWKHACLVAIGVFALARWAMARRRRLSILQRPLSLQSC